MNENKEKMLELLVDQAAFGLSEEEAVEVEMLLKEFPEWENDNSFELTATAISLANLDTSEPMPAHLRTKILADSGKFFVSNEKAEEKEEYQKTLSFEPKRSGVFEWLGWAFAAAFLVVLGINLWTNRVQDTAKIENPPNIQTPTPELTAKQKLEQIMASANKIQAAWTPPKPDETNPLSGDIVWDNAKQEGYMRFRGLPVNDANKETYQLWIFDENQDEKTPIDGGVFDVNEKGEVIVPINAKLKVKNPKMFAITVEKPGGVVVSKREKIVALAKV
jgi:hypothetical protein